MNCHTSFLVDSSLGWSRYCSWSIHHTKSFHASFGSMSPDHVMPIWNHVALAMCPINAQLKLSIILVDYVFNSGTLSCRALVVSMPPRCPHVIPSKPEWKPMALGYIPPSQLHQILTSLVKPPVNPHNVALFVI